MKLTLRSLVVFFVSIAVLISGHLSGIARPLETKLISGLRSSMQPFLSFRNAVSESMRGTGALEKELAECRDQRAYLTAESAKMLLLEKENETLHKELQFGKRVPQPRVMAYVLSSVSGLGRQMITIDKGSKDRITVGSIVVSEGAAVIGKIYRVQEHTATILLLTDSQSRVIANILAKNGATGVVSGEFQLGLRMDLIPVTHVIKQNDLVVTAGLEKGIPPGLVIGTVDSLTTRPSDLYQTARIRPALSYNDVRIVSVIVPQSIE